MSKKTKIWLIIAASLILIGCIIFGGAMTLFKWDFKKLSTVKYETNNYEINEKFNNISIISDTADIVLTPAENVKASVVCCEQKNVKHSVAVKEDTLVIELVDRRKWYEHIGINFGTQKITVYIPQGEYGLLSVKSDTSDVEIPDNFKFESIDISVSTGDVKCLASALEKAKIKASTGDICVENISADTLELSASTGKITANSITCEGDVKIKVSTGKTSLTDIECKNLVSKGSTGKISLENVIAKEKFSINRDTGDISFKKCDAAEIFVETDTGDVTGSLLSEKVFITKTSTGDIDVPKTITGGKCEITTDTGDIKIEIE
ncbi:MAG: DUF4097 family beta strand repeat protein [Clostridia bacterium]|nr:DUF4097 family beta strand repeat protein [Clostridia bacterium]